MKHTFRLLLSTLLCLSLLLPLAACNTNQNQPEETTPASTEPDISISPEALGEPTITYDCQDGSALSAYANKTAEDFAGVCAYYEKQGYTVYNATEKNGNLFATYTKDASLAHVYWVSHSGELNLVESDSAGTTLPPATPAVTSGDIPVTVTQMKDAGHVNGMGYIIQLSDGSFVVYDGAYSDQAKKLVTTMEDMTPEGQIPVIRAWVLTHSHNDHHPTFNTVARRLSSRVKVEYVLFAPIDPKTAEDHGGDTYFNDTVHDDMKKLGAQAVYVHTGMEFTFCNLKMEILMTSDDIYKAGIHNNYFNNSSTVSRLYGEDYSALFTGDCGKESAELMMAMYGDNLQSNMCQVSHHGVEDVPLSFYETVKASILFYPCNQWLYDQTDRHWDVRMALEDRDYTKEILIAGLGQYTRAWGTVFEANAPLSIPDHPDKNPTA